MTYPWMQEGMKHIGLKEIPGSKHNSVIVGWLKQLSAWWTDDETPWCGVYVAHCMRTAGLVVPKYYMRAKAWGEEWGQTLAEPAEGCIVVFERQGGGHVGFVVGVTPDGFLAVLGGNQGNSVSIGKFNRDRVVGYFWPAELNLPDSYSLKTVNLSGQASVNEA